MEDAGLLIEGFSPTLAIVLGIAGFVFAVVVLVMLSRNGDKLDSGVQKGVLAMFSLLLVGICSGGAFGVGYMFEKDKYSTATVSEVEQHYGVNLLNREGEELYGATQSDSSFTDPGYIPVHIDHNNQIHEQARLHKTEEGDDMRFVLMFNPGEDTSEMEEFDAELAQSSETDSEEF